MTDRTLTDAEIAAMNGPFKATDARESERQMMSASVSKSDREWWAYIEICRLRRQLEKVRLAIDEEPS